MPSPIISEIFEGQFIQISEADTATDILLGNIYRPPRDLLSNYKSFIQELALTLNTFLNGNFEIIVRGDMNIDLLQIKEKDFVNDFFYMLVSSGFFPRITLPTRISNSSATLLDNFICKLTNKSENSIAGILSSPLSDHFPYFISLAHSRSAKRTDKYIVKQTPPVFLNNYNIYSQINKDINADPDINYNIVHNILKTATEEHLAPKIVKFKKHRHKKTKWITQGIIKSISFRDKLYKEYRKSPMNTVTRERLKTNLNTYNKILKSNILLAKRKH